MSNNFFYDRDKNNIKKIAKYLENLPDFCLNFFLDKENYTSSLTRLNYAMDLKIFFEFISKYKFGCKSKSLTYSNVNEIKSTDILSFLSYISYYTINGKNYKNNEKGKARKLASVRTFFKWAFNNDYISADVASKVSTPKIHQKEIIRLEVEEVAKLLNLIESTENMSLQQQKFNMHTKERDIAILSLFLSTGIRVSECVGLNVNDFDFENNAFKITRKGGNQAVLYFSIEVRDSLLNWLKIRLEKKLPKTEQAMFISLQNKRLSIRAVENLVKKYAKIITPLKNISPHKLRSTFGTNLYRETGDIYIVADVLGHKDVNTTKKHYAAISEDLRKNVANVIKLRK